jgi:acyl-CoA thioester hydrolase
VAAGYFVHVYVDRAGRRPLPLTETQKASVADLVLG